MLLYNRVLITALIGPLLFFTAFSAMADISGHMTIIDTSVTGIVTGNTGSNNQTTNLNSGSDVPPYSSSENVYDNHLIIKNGGSISSASYGGVTYGTGNVYGNTVTIESGGTAASSNYVYGGYSLRTGNVSDNTVTVSGTAGTVYGGYSGLTGNVTDNIVTISGTVTNEVYGGVAYGSGNVTGNEVIVESGGQVYFAFGGASTGAGAVTGNIVTISGTVTNEVYGGYTIGTGMANDNTVNIESTANLAGASLYGRNNAASGTGNTLNVNGFSGSVATMANFDSYNFVLGRLGSGDGLTFIEITGSAVNIDGSEINISFAPEFQASVLNMNDVITVISSINTAANPASVTVTTAATLFVTYGNL